MKNTVYAKERETSHFSLAHFLREDMVGKGGSRGDCMIVIDSQAPARSEPVSRVL